MRAVGVMRPIMRVSRNKYALSTSTTSIPELCFLFALTRGLKLRLQLRLELRLWLKLTLRLGHTAELEVKPKASGGA